MRHGNGRSIRGSAIVSALLVLGPLAAAGAQASTPTTRRSAPPAQFSIPASARVHTATSAAPPAGAAQSTAPGAATAAKPVTATTPAPTTATTPTPTTQTSTTIAPLTAAPATKSSTAVPPTQVARTAGPTKLSTGAIVAAALAAMLIVVCLAWGAARWWAYEPRWTVSLRHSLAEAGWRLSGTWDEFSDWIRLGR